MLFLVEILRLSSLPVVGKWVDHSQNNNSAPGVCFGCTDKAKRIGESKVSVTVMEAWAAVVPKKVRGCGKREAVAQIYGLGDSRHASSRVIIQPRATPNH
jgi:hypothetical protein